MERKAEKSLIYEACRKHELYTTKVPPERNS